MRLSTLSVAAAALFFASAAATAGQPSFSTFRSGGGAHGGHSVMHGGHGVVHGGYRAHAPVAARGGWSGGHGSGGHGLRVGGGPAGWGHGQRAWRPGSAAYTRDRRGWSRSEPVRHAGHAGWRRSHAGYGAVVVIGGGAEAPVTRSFAEPPLAPTAHYVVSMQPQIIYVGPPPQEAPKVRVVSGTQAGASRYARPGTRWRDERGAEWLEY